MSTLDTAIGETFRFTSLEALVDSEIPEFQILEAVQNTVERVDGASDPGPFRGFVGASRHGSRRGSRGSPVSRGRRRRGRDRGSGSAAVASAGRVVVLVDGKPPGLSTHFRTIADTWLGALGVTDCPTSITNELVTTVTLGISA
jgi:hypothetical protein